MKLFTKSNRHFLGLLVGFYLLLNFLIWTQLTRQIENDKTETINAAIRHNSNLAIALEQHTIRTIRDADATLQLVKLEFEQHGTGINLEKLFSSGILNVPYFNGFIITDSTGRSILGYPASLDSLHLNIADRSFFRLHKKYADTLLISKPFQSRSIHKTVVVLSRGIKDSKGRFRGIVAIQLLPSTFLSFYSQANLRKYDILSLIAPDGITYSRRTGAVESSGEDIQASPLFRYVRQTPVGSYNAKDAIRGIPSYFSYRQLKDFPVIATVGSTESDILAAFRLRRQREYFFGAVISFLLLVFLFAVFFAFRQRRNSLNVLKKSEARYRSIFESSRDAILLLEPDGSIEAMNHAANAMFGLSVTKSDKIRFPQLFAKTEPEVVYSFDERNRLTIEGKEVLFHCLDGVRFTGDIASSSFFDDQDRQYTLVLIRDVTQRKSMEQKLQNEQKRYQRLLTKQIIVAQEREREIIGHELHDNVNQILTTVKLYLETALQREDCKKDLIERSIGYLLQCIKEIRNLSHSLSAPTLGTQSLVDSIQALIEDVSSCTDFAIHFHVEKYRQPVSKELSLALYRIVQEQFTNIIKHAHATVVAVHLSQTAHETHLVIEDNGRGFEPVAQSNGIGLNNISSRVKAFNGRLSIQAAVGKGCRLSVRLPHADIWDPVNADLY
jgi:PAS domain S-box-containing protein